MNKKSLTTHLGICIGFISLFVVFSVTAQQIIPAPTDSSSTGDSLMSLLLNGIPVNLFLASMFWGLIGMGGNVVSDIIRSNTRARSENRKFSIHTWYSINGWRFLRTLIFLPVAIVFCNKIFDMDITTLRAFFIGLSADHISEIISKYKASSNVLNVINKEEAPKADDIQPTTDNSGTKE